MSDTVNLDPNHGRGGSYVINPETNERALVERTAEPPRPGDAEPEADESAPEE